MEIFHDGGDGVTERSLAFLRDWLTVNRHRWKARQVCLDADREVFTLQINGFIMAGLGNQLPEEPCILLLSGTSAGYGGTGPHGSMAALAYLVDKTFTDHRRVGPAYWLNEEPEIRKNIVMYKHLHFDLRYAPKIFGELKDVADLDDV